MRSEHLDTTIVGDKEVAAAKSEQNDESRLILRRSKRRQADRARKPQANRAHGPGDDRDS